MFNFAAKFADGLSYHDFLARHGNEEHRRRWAAVHERVQLTLEQREVLDGFVREMKVLVPGRRLVRRLRKPMSDFRAICRRQLADCHALFRSRRA